MGGFFAPDPPPPAPASPPVAVVAANDGATQARLDAVERNRRGLYGTIATSDSGLLQSQAPAGKSLLGD